jgi:hypothetical protein
MEWNKKVIDKPVEKEKSVLSTDLLGTVRKFKPVTPVQNIVANVFDPMDYLTRKLAQDALLDAECGKAKALILIRRTSFI